MANEGSPPPPQVHTIFVDTSIDTHLAMVVSPSDTISDVKAKIKAEHAICFQDNGEIAIQAVKVRRRGFFYNLAESMYVLNAFEGVEGSWFLCVDVVPMCHVKNQKALANKVTLEHLKNHNYAIPDCGVGKNPDAVVKKLLSRDLNKVIPSTSVEHENQKSVDTSLKELPAEDGPSLQNGKNSRAQILQVHSIDELTPGDRHIKTMNVMNVNEAQLHEGVAISPCEPEKKSVPDGQTIHNPIVTNIDHDHMPDMLIDQEKDGRRKDDCKNHGVEACDAMPSTTCTHKTISGKRRKSSRQDKVLEIQSQHYLVEKKMGKKLKDGLHEEHLEDHRRGSKSTGSEYIDKSNKSVNLPQEISCDGKKEILAASSEGLPTELPHENTSLQKPHVEKHAKKRKRKSSNLQEEVHLAMPSETLVARSPQVTADPRNLGKDANASVFSGEYPTEPRIDESLPNDDRDMSTALDTANLLKVANQKEIIHSTEINKEPIEDQILQVNSKDLCKKNVILGQENNVDVSLKEPEETRIPSKAASEFPTKLYCSTYKFKSQSSEVLEPKKANDQQRREFNATKCITELNLRKDEARFVDENAVISVSTEKFPCQEQPANAVSKNSSGDKHQGLDREIDAANNLKGAIKDRFLTQVDSKGVSKSRRSRKKSRTESSGVCKSTEVNGNGENFNSISAQVILNDSHNEASAVKFIKQADQKANGGLSVDTMIEISSSSKKVPNPDEVSNMNSGNPPISMPPNVSKLSNAFVNQAAEIRVPSQPASEIQAKPHRSRKRSKSELSKLGFPENIDVVLPKFNGKVTESNEGRGSDPSKLANWSNQKIEQHCIDAEVTVPLSDENSSKLFKVPRVNPLDPSSCKLQDLSEQSNAKIIINEGDLTQHGALAGPSKSKGDRKKSKKEVLKAQVYSEMSEHMDLCRPDDSSINFGDYFVPRQGKRSPVVHASDLPSGKSETRGKNKNSSKSDINQPYQDSPTNLVHPSSHKQHMVIGQPQENDSSYLAADLPSGKSETRGKKQNIRESDINQPYQDSPTNLLQPSSHKQHMVIGQPQENDSSHYGTVDTAQGEATEYTKTGNARKAKKSKQSTKQNPFLDIIESGSSLLKAHDNKFEKKPQNYGPQSHAQLSKSGDMEGKQVKKITADGKGETLSLEPDHGIDNMGSKDAGVRYKGLKSSTISNPTIDAVGSKKINVSPSEGMEMEVASSDSIEDTSKMRYRVVRKKSSRSKKITNSSNPENSLLASPGRIFRNALGTSSESENDPYKKKVAIKTALDDLSTSGGSDSHLEEVQTKASALKLQMDTKSSGAEHGEIGKEAVGRTKNRSRSIASTQKMPLGVVLKSSSSYKEGKLTTSQSEFPDTESQPIDVVLETQPEPAAPSEFLQI